MHSKDIELSFFRPAIFSFQFFGVWRMEFGEGLIASLTYGDWERALHVRRRLFNRGYANTLFICAVRYQYIRKFNSFFLDGLQ